MLSTNMQCDTLIASKSEIDKMGIGTLSTDIINANVMSNAKYLIDDSGTTTIIPNAIKLSKIFVVTANVIVTADDTCDGNEIIIYNNNSYNSIQIRDSGSIIDKCLGKGIRYFIKTS